MRTIESEFDARRNSLNALRMVLAVSVIVSHSWPLGGYGEDPGFGDQDLGDWAVAGFFAISGYLITMSRLKLTSPVDFFWRRIMRIYPAFVVCLVIVAFGFAPLSVALFNAGTYAPSAGAGYVVHNLALFINQFGIPGTLESAPFPDSWNGALWSLFYEFMCYVGIGLLVSVVPRRLVPTAIAAVFVVCTAATCLHLFTDYDAPKTIVLFARLGAFFAAGALVYVHRERVRLSKYITGLAAGLVFLTVFTGTFQAFAALPLAYLMMSLSITLPLDRVGAKNDISYGMYIYAFPVQQMLAQLFPGSVLPVWVFAVFSIALTVPFACASWFLVENRVRRLAPPRWLKAPQTIER